MAWPARSPLGRTRPGLRVERRSVPDSTCTDQSGVAVLSKGHGIRARRCGFALVEQPSELAVMMPRSCRAATVPSMSKAQLLGGGSHSHPGDGAGTADNRRVERRRNSTSDDAPMDILKKLPAVVVLERIPVPTIAITRDGTILFANTAFTEMVGYRQGSLARAGFPGNIPYGAGRGVRAFWRRCTGEPARRTAASRRLDGAGQGQQVGVEAFR